MSGDTEKHHKLLNELKAAKGKSDGSFEHAVTSAFEQVFENLGRLRSHMFPGGPTERIVP